MNRVAGESHAIRDKWLGHYRKPTRSLISPGLAQVHAAVSGCHLVRPTRDLDPEVRHGKGKLVWRVARNNRRNRRPRRTTLAITTLKACSAGRTSRTAHPPSAPILERETTHLHEIADNGKDRLGGGVDLDGFANRRLAHEFISRTGVAERNGALTIPPTEARSRTSRTKDSAR